MINLKLAKKKGNSAKEATIGYEQEDYPYGTRLSFEKESLKKLGKSVTDFEIGDLVTVVAKAKVIELSQHQGNRDSERVELQVTDIELDLPSNIKQSQDFMKAKRNGATIKTITGPNSVYGLKEGQKMLIAQLNGTSYSGKVEKN